MSNHLLINDWGIKDAFAVRNQQSIVTKTSVLAIKYEDCVMMAADNLSSYGSLARFKDVQRPHPGGLIQDRHEIGPEIHEYLSQLMYVRWSKMNPLWNSLLIGGFKDGKR
ncbi:hypothetical protein BDR04DRAFT_1140479 [Suillus decipiens]|nr:hypothetical protein BDR04DRAFT_1140479 [Suillus decipiens]